MSNETGRKSTGEGAAAEVQQRLAAMGTMVESLFAECIVALIDESPDLVSDMRAEDTRAHEQCLQLDKLCVEMLCGERPDPERARAALAAVKIAGALKRIADNALRIAEASQACGRDSVGVARSLKRLPRMAELMQGMLGDAVDALIRRRPEASTGLHLVLSEIRDAGYGIPEDLAGRILDGTMTPEAAARFCQIGQILEQMGSEVLEIANQTRCMAAGNGEG